jgi:hypothetical protein
MNQMTLKGFVNTLCAPAVNATSENTITQLLLSEQLQGLKDLEL